MKKFIYFSLYFSEGAPIGFIWWALPSILAKQGLTTTQIATISALAVLPWTFKFAFAPMIDLLSMRKVRLKSQLLTYQLLMGVSLFFIEDAIMSKNQNQILIVLIIHGIFAALQDICIDSLAIKNLPKNELGKMNGVMQSGMLVGRSLFGGAGAYIAYSLGLKMTVFFLISSIWISLIMLQKVKLKEVEQKKVKLKEYFRDFWVIIKQYNFWLLLGVAYFSTYSYNGISTIAGAILTKQGATAIEYGLTYSLLIPASMAIGALLGGKWSDQRDPIKTLTYTLLFTILSSIFVGFIIDQVMGSIILISSYVLFYFFIGATTASLYGLLMKNTSVEFAALEFSIFMAVVNLSDSNTSYLTGQLVSVHSTFKSTIIIGSICFLSLILLRALNKKTLNKSVKY